MSISDSMRLELSPHLGGLLESRGCLAFREVPGGRDTQSEVLHDPAGELLRLLAGRRVFIDWLRVGWIVELRDDREHEAPPLRVAEPYVLLEERRHGCREPAAPKYLPGSGDGQRRRPEHLVDGVDGGLGLAQWQRVATVLLDQPDEESVSVQGQDLAF
jgi:hypothetical protein